MGKLAGKPEGEMAEVRRAALSDISTTPPVTAPTKPKSDSVMRREAMLGRDQKIVAYTLMLRAQATTLPATARARDEILLSSLARLDLARILGQRGAFIPVSPTSLDLPQITAWPVAGIVWLLQDTSPPDAEAISRVEALKRDGSHFAVDGSTALNADWAPLVALADYVLIDVGNEDITAITNLMAAVSRLTKDARFVATHVPSLEIFHACHKLQFALFMGPFITRREMLDSPSMESSRAKILDLMNRVRSGAEQNDLATHFRHDPALSVRLLRYVNSPGMGLMSKIGGIEQALMVMGQDKLYRWLTLILFTGGQAQALDNAVLENALLRGRLAEQLAGKALFAKARDEIFVAGLFSLLDVVMHMPMETVLKQVPLPAEITEAILHQRGPYAPYLTLAIACEQDDQTAIETLAAQIDREVADINAAHMEALVWVQEIGEV